MRIDVVSTVRAFEEPGKVVFAQPDDDTLVLVPVDSGCPIVIQAEDEELFRVRAGIDIELVLDYETSLDDFPEILAALQDGHAEERFSSVYRNRLSHAGYAVEYPHGSRKEVAGEKRSREYTVKLPVWNAR